MRLAIRAEAVGPGRRGGAAKRGTAAPSAFPSGRLAASGASSTGRRAVPPAYVDSGLSGGVRAAARSAPEGGGGIAEFVETALREYGLLAAALLPFVGELGIPTGVPIEVALLVVGSQSVGSVPALLVGIVLLTAADLLGMTILHVAARTGGVKLLARRTARHEARTEAAMARLRGWFGGRDALAVFVLRLVPVVRVGITIGTGLLRIRPRNFYLGALPASVVWAGAPLTLGFGLRDDVAALEAGVAAAAEVLPIAGLGAVVVLVVLLLVASGRRRLAARRARGRSLATSPSPSASPSLAPPPPPPSAAGPKRRPAPDLG